MYDLFSESGHNQNLNEGMVNSGPSVISTNAGTSGVDMTNRPITSVGSRPGYTGEHDMSDGTIREVGWDLQRIMERPNLVATFDWSDTSPRFMQTYVVPRSLITTVLAKVPFSTFHYWRGDIILRIQVAGAPLYQGLLAISFIPLTTLGQASTYESNIAALTLNPTVYLYANTNSAGELRIPFNHYQSYLSTDFSADPSGQLGVIKIFWMNPLMAESAGKSVTVSIFSIFENSEFKVPKLSSTINPVAYATDLFSESEMLGQVLGGVVSGIGRDLLGQLGKTATSLLSGTGTVDMVPTPVRKAASGARRAVKAMTTRSSMAEVLEEATGGAMPANFLGDALDMASQMFGLDNPTIPCPDPVVAIKGNGPMNYAVGPEHIEKLAIYPSAMSMVTAETFATGVDEMDIDYLKTRYSYYTSFTQQRTNVAGDILLTLPLSPVLIPKDSVGTVVQNKGAQVPLISYLGIPFRYWSGTLVYKLQVIASVMHTTKIFVAFNYEVFTAPTSLLDTTSQYGQVLEIAQGSNEFEFRVPYVSETPYKDVYNGTYGPDNSMGLLHVVVLNPLVAPSSVAQQISYNLFIAAGPDFGYEVLSNYNPIVPILSSTPVAEMTLLKSQSRNQIRNPLISSESDRRHKSMLGLFRPQSRVSEVKDLFSESSSSNLEDSTAPTNIATTITDAVVDVPITAPPLHNVGVDAHFGIPTSSVRDLLKKYQYCGTRPLVGLPASGDVAVGMATIFNISEFLTPTSMSTDPYSKPNRRSTGLLAWAAAMFRQWRGSLRYKLVVNGLQLNQCARVVWYPYSGLSSGDPNMENIYITQSIRPFSEDSEATHLQEITPITQSTLLPLAPNLMMMANFPIITAEGEIPFTTKYNSLITAPDQESNVAWAQLGNLAVIVTPPSEAGLTVNADLYLAFGDETRFGTLYNAPLIYVSAMAGITGTPLGPVFPSTYSLLP